MGRERLRPLSGPSHVGKRALPVRLWSAPAFRICRLERDPTYFGRQALSRFDDPRQEFGVLYAAASSEGAFVETCIRNERPKGGRRLSQVFLEERRLVRISFPESLRLVDLTGRGLAWLGADGRLTTGAYGLSQRWSRALWIHPDRPDGILYCSRFNLSLQCIAVFDRAGAGISWEDLGPLLDIRNRIFLGEMLARYDFALL